MKGFASFHPAVLLGFFVCAVVLTVLASRPALQAVGVVCAAAFYLCAAGAFRMEDGGGAGAGVRRVGAGEPAVQHAGRHGAVHLAGRPSLHPRSAGFRRVHVGHVRGRSALVLQLQPRDDQRPLHVPVRQAGARACAGVHHGAASSAHLPAQGARHCGSAGVRGAWRLAGQPARTHAGGGHPAFCAGGVGLGRLRRDRRLHAQPWLRDRTSYHLRPLPFRGLATDALRSCLRCCLQGPQSASHRALFPWDSSQHSPCRTPRRGPPRSAPASWPSWPRLPPSTFGRPPRGAFFCRGPDVFVHPDPTAWRWTASRSP